ncbi:hypothetical protein [Kibdelosporangium persicum]|uniref:hypothetical protein n=1 Tax=Kibdelosporangium persicum TaxID=2698649 RepID=UPI001562FEE3|nr:hypothetical protein [Kibdelosporangium persicum]
MLYGIGCVDASGRISERHMIHALDWKPGQRFDVTLITRGIVIRASPDGSTVLPRTQRLVVPLTARRHCDITAGDRLLLAAAPQHGVIIVHTATALDEMLIQYHASSAGTP